MKKVIFENGLKAFLVAFSLLLLGSVGASAQAKLTAVATVPGVSNPPVPSSPVYQVPTGSFVSTQQAKAILDATLLQMKETLLQLTQNDPAFTAYQVKYKYFQNIRDNLEVGANVPNAIAAGLWIFLQDQYELGGVAASTQSQLKADAVALLDI